MRDFLTFDSETDPFKYGRTPKPFLWGAYDGEEFRTWEDTKEFARWLGARDVIAYAHNSGKFDTHFLLDYLNPQDVTVINGRIAKIRLGKAEIRDSFLVLPVALAQYQKDDIEYWKLEACARGRHWQEIVDYLRGDCVYLFELVKRWRDEFGDALTLAGAAFRRLCGSIDEKRPKTREVYDDAVRPWYFGGRVECRKRGEVDGPIFVRDIRSAYPWAMSECRHPWGVAHTVIHGAPNEIRETDLYKVRAESIGAFPFRTEDGGVDFPADYEKREFHVTGHELIAAELDPRQVEFLETRRWDRTVSFADYVSDLYGRKRKAEEAGDAAGRLIAKLLLNSSYGKLASDSRRYSHYQIISGAELKEYDEAGWSVEADPCDGKHLVVRHPLEEWERKYIDVAPAASITGAVRARLWTAIKACERGPGEVIYCDTDCVHVLADDPPPLDVAPDLGAWSDEGTAETGWYVSKKVYALKTSKGWKSACKGARLTPQQIIRVARGKPVAWAQESPCFSWGEAKWLTRIISLAEDDPTD